MAKELKPMTNLQKCGLNSTLKIKENSTINAHCVDNQSLKKRYLFLRHRKNPTYEDGLKNVPIRSCLLHNKVNAKTWIIKTEPKWITDLLEHQFDTNTGEILATAVYTTNDLKSGNNRKIKALNRFCDIFQPLYRKYSISLFFGTLTLANQSRCTIKQFLNGLKARLKRNGVLLLGYVWVLEISKDGHIHYHYLLATNRINIKGKSIPKFLLFDDLWGCRTQIEFSKKNVRGYLAKYFVKNNARILNSRLYGMVIRPEYKNY